MAKLFLDANDTFTVSNDVEVVGSASGSETVIISGAPNVQLDANIERVELSGNAADYTFQVVGTTITVFSNGNAVATLNGLNQNAALVFADGAAELALSGLGTATLGGESLPATAGAVTPTLDSSDTSSSAGTSPSTGASFTLTTDDDTFNGSSGNDTITGTTTTITGDADRIVDTSSTDNDVMNITYTGATGAFDTVQGIESINVDMNVFDGTASAFDANNIEGATITFSSSKLGYNGAVDVDNAGDNTIVAGTNVTDIDIASVASDTAINLTVGADVNATLTGGAAVTDVNITATATAEVDLVDGALAASVTDINVTGDATIAGDSADLTGLTIAGGALNINAATGAGTLDAEEFTVSAIEVSTAATLAITNAEGNTVNLTAEDADLTVNTSGTTTTEAVTINVSADQDGATGLSLGANVDTATIALTADVTELAVLNVAGATTLTIAGDVELVDVNQNAATDTLTISGAGAVTLTAVDNAEVNLSGVTGVVTATLDGTSQTITTGDEADEITLAATGVAAIIANAGNDNVDALAVTTGTVAAELGDGDDTIEFDNSVTAATIALDGGTGTDTLVLTAASFTTAATFALTNFENVTTDGTAAFNADQISGQTLAVAGTSGTGDEVTVAAEAADTVIDLSGLTIAASVDGGLTVVATAATGDVTITGSASADDITASGNDDVIDAGAGDDAITSAAGIETLTGGAGDDSFTVVSTLAAMDRITDFQAAATAGDNDTLVMSVAAVDGDILLVDSVDVSAASANGGTDILAVITNGIFTVGGTDAAEIDTLAEWHAAALLASADATANVIAFEFDGNTYVSEDGAGDAEVSFIELTGVTGITAVDTTAAADTILIA